MLLQTIYPNLVFQALKFAKCLEFLFTKNDDLNVRVVVVYCPSSKRNCPLLVLGQYVPET
eukprot:snap_masked-scaffold_4-processed-gene-16.15-mRNA-1 protein AED:1.00 eAED:1.00 QI:0/0/0/0/1/1/2/0/59